MEKLTQEQFNLMTRDERGYINIPDDTDCSDVDFYGTEMIIFGDRCELYSVHLGAACVFGRGTKFAGHCMFGPNSTFGGGCVLSGCDASHSDLHGSIIRGCDLSNSDMRRCDLSGCDLSNSNISGCDMYAANLAGSNLAASTLEGSNISHCDLRNSDMTHCILREAVMHGCDMRGCVGIISQSQYMSAAFEKCADGYVVYMALPSRAGYLPGMVIDELCSTDRTDLGGCGLRVGTYDAVEASFDGAMWKALLRWEWLPDVCVPYGANGTIRVGRIELLEIEQEYAV